MNFCELPHLRVNARLQLHLVACVRVSRNAESILTIPRFVRARVQESPAATNRLTENGFQEQIRFIAELRSAFGDKLRLFSAMSQFPGIHFKADYWYGNDGRKTKPAISALITGALENLIVLNKKQPPVEMAVLMDATEGLTHEVLFNRIFRGNKQFASSFQKYAGYDHGRQSKTSTFFQMYRSGL